MSHPFNTFALRMRVHCKNCEKKLKNELLKFKGVRSVKIDQEHGKVIISGKVDSAKILSKLEKVGREAELWCEKDVNIIPRLKVIDPLNDPDIMAQLEKYADDSSVKSVEVTKTIKVTFKGESRNGPSDKIVETTNNNNVKKCHDHSHGSRLCSASSSCCSGHATINHSHNHHGCCHGNTTSFGPCCAHGRNSCYNYHCQYGNCSYGSCYANSISPSAGPTWTNDNIPSAPPLPDDYYEPPPSPPSSGKTDDYYHQAPPQPPSSAMADGYYQGPLLPPSLAMPHSYYSFLSEEKANGCIIL